MNQPTWSAIEAAIYSAVLTGAQTVEAGVMLAWEYQNVNSQALDMVTLALGSIATVFTDSIVDYLVVAWAASTAYVVGDIVENGANRYLCTTAGTSAGAGGPTGTGSSIADGSCVWAYQGTKQEIASAVLGTREVALKIEAFTATTVENPAAGQGAANSTARAICDAIKSQLRLPSTRASLAAVGFTPFDPGEVQWIPDVVSVGFRGRALLEIRCYLPARALEEYSTYVAAISSLGVTVKGGPAGDLTATIHAP